MTQPPTPLGVIAISWAQTETDGVAGLDLRWLQCGATWRWQGQTVRLDGAANALHPGAPLRMEDLNKRARPVAERLSGAASPIPATVPPDRDPPPMALVLTDGATVFTGRLVAAAGGWIIVFAGALPPPEQDLFILDVRLPPAFASRPQDVICFADDTLIATPDGAVCIDQLRPGDLVLTKDDGPQPVLWTGRSHLSGLALRRFPHLRPIRLRDGALGTGRPEDDLRVSPGHRLLVGGERARALFGAAEVLVCARDLVDHGAITQDLALHGVTYVHLLLERHQIVFANGVPTESFHPALAAPEILHQHRRELSALHPDLCLQPDSYGQVARRCLRRGEVALLAA